MNSAKKLLVVTSLVAASIAMAATDGITLRKTLKTGTESYHVQSKSKQTITVPGGGDQELETTSTTSYSVKIGALVADGGSAPVDIVSKVEKFDIGGPMADMMGANKDQFMKSTTSSGTLDTKNRFTPDPKAKLDPMAVLNGSTSNSLLGLFLEFPDKAVNVGDTWDVVIKKSPVTGKQDQKLTAKLEAEKQVDGKDVYVVSISGTIKTDIDFAELVKASGQADLGPIGQMEMQIKGSIDFKGEANVDKTTGQTILMKIKLDTKQEMQVQGQSIPSTGTSTVTLTVDK